VEWVERMKQTDIGVEGWKLEIIVRLLPWIQVEYGNEWVRGVFRWKG